MTRLFWLLTLTAVEAAFGPATPLLGVPCNSGGVGSNNNSPLVMRVGNSDLVRRQRMNELFKTLETSPFPTAEDFVKDQLLSQDTSTLLEKCQWKLRRALLRKIRDAAYQHGIEVDPNFGYPPTQDEREAKEQEQGVQRKAERSAYYAEIKQAQVSRLAARAEEEARRKAEKERAEQRKAEREAARKAEEERIAAEKKAEEERIAAEKKAEEERIAAEKKAEEERIAAEKKAEEERIAAEKKAEEERIAAEKKAEEERLAAEAAAVQKAEEEEAVKQAEEERLAVEAAAAKKAEEEEAARKAEEERVAAEAAAAKEVEQSSSEPATVDEVSSSSEESTPKQQPIATVTTQMIKELRESTGAGMMDCKKALMESGGDMEDAAVFLRKKGLAKADKKASRVAAEGKIAFSSSGNKAVLVEVNCETDFVGKDANFGGFCNQVAQAAVDVENDSVEALLESKVADGTTVEETRQAMVAKIGENIQVRRMISRGGEGRTVGAYVHMNRIGEWCFLFLFREGVFL